MAQIIERVFRCRDNLNVEAFKQSTRPERVGCELRGDLVIIEIGGLRRQQHFKPEAFRKDPIEPHPRRCPAKQMVTFCKKPPAFARVSRWVANAQIFKCYAL